MSDTIITSTISGKVLIVETKDGPVTYDSKFAVAALLIMVAKGSGQIAPEESAQMIELLGSYFKIEGAESLDLLTRAITELAERPDLPGQLAEFGGHFSEKEQEEILLMALKVIAADGRREFEEMEQFSNAVAAANIRPEIVHRAYDRYFAETMPGS